ncbi:polysaccharide deacetylase family protein [uncultured Mitsuokella sp.]|uniref:polysaccharide deacetylase family protein n=1 Tax=uncultured Mitsuokella sp. TaxID=453120 RepID=UPI0025F6848F|nr:polysaccharide deacetylase family protein [uncultured Mitsuokella sp.]
MSRLKKWLLSLCFLLLAFVLWLVFSPAPKGVPVLEYHEVADSVDDDAYIYNVPPEDFRQQLDYLKSQGYTTISMLDYMKARRGKQALPARPIILTFDDGYEDNYTTLLPILEEYDMKATVYVITNEIGQPDYMNWDQLRDMQAHGIEIGGHTANHQPLTQMDPQQREDEVRLSKLLLEWNGIHTVYAFSYPNGAYDDTMPALLAENQYLTAVTGDTGINVAGTNPYLMQRINIPHPRFGLTEFKLRLWKAELYTKLGIRQHRDDQ